MVTPHIKVALSIQVVWKEAPSKQAARVSIDLHRMRHYSPMATGQEADFHVDCSVPSETSFSELLIGDYFVDSSVSESTLYVRDVTFGSDSVLHRMLHLGNGIGTSTLRVVVAGDSGFVNVTVIDGSGKPIPKAEAVITPRAYSSEGQLAAETLGGEANANGTYLSTALAPGQYYISSPAEVIERTPEGMAQLLRMRAGDDVLDIQSNSMTTLRLAPRSPK